MNLFHRKAQTEKTKQLKNDLKDPDNHDVAREYIIKDKPLNKTMTIGNPLYQGYQWTGNMVEVRSGPIKVIDAYKSIKMDGVPSFTFMEVAPNSFSIVSTIQENNAVMGDILARCSFNLNDFTNEKIFASILSYIFDHESVKTEVLDNVVKKVVTSEMIAVRMKDFLDNVVKIANIRETEENLEELQERVKNEINTSDLFQNCHMKCDAVMINLTNGDGAGSD